MPTLEHGEDSKERRKRRKGRPAGSVKITIDDVAEMHGFPVPTVYGWTRQKCRDGKPVLPVTKFGHLVRVLRSDAEKVPERLKLRTRRAAPSFFSKRAPDADGGNDE